MAYPDKTIVLVTGANQGLGFETVKQLAAEQPSYNILLGSRNIDKGKAAAESLGTPSNVTPIQIDVNSDDSIDDCVKKIKQDYGRLDVLVNNAGTAGLDFPKDMSKRDQWRSIFELNVISVAMLTEAMAPLLNLSSRPSVVMVSSGLGSVNRTLTAPRWADWMNYSTSKGALNNLTAQFVRKYPKWKVNAACPGYCATNINAAWDDPRAATAATGATVAVRLCVETANKDGPNGTNAARDGAIEAW